MGKIDLRIGTSTGQALFVGQLSKFGILPSTDPTNPLGPVQPRVVTFVEGLLRRDIAEFGLVTIIEPNALAYALVRLVESFLYADVLADRKPDVATADRLTRALIEGILP